MTYYCQNPDHKPIAVEKGKKCPGCGREINWEQLEELEKAYQSANYQPSTLGVYPVSKFIKKL